LVVFRVPRLHEVRPVRTNATPRYSIFGWFLAPGKLYALDTERKGREADEEESGEPEAQGGGDEAKAGSKGKKRRASDEGGGMVARCKLAKRLLKKAAKKGRRDMGGM
jgi:hypothetical protein